MTTSTTTASARRATTTTMTQWNQDVDNDGNGATEDYVDDDDGDRMTDDDINNDSYGATDDNINDGCDSAMDGCHCLDACGGCATKVDARQRHVTTGNTTTSQ